MVESEALMALLGAASAPLSTWTARYPGHRPMGYLCSYVPEELIHSAGLTPVRLRGNSASLHHADAHLQSFACALCRSVLDQTLTGDVSCLAGLVFAHTCDAMQALADMTRMNTGSTLFVDTVMVPTNLGSRAARSYLIAELNRFRERLSSFVSRSCGDHPGSQPRVPSLQASISIYNTTRRLVQSLEGRRDRLSARQFLAVLDAAQVMPRELFNPLLARLVDEVETVPARSNGPGLYLVGAVLDEPRILELVEEVGARVVGDDLCSGSRHFHGQVGEKGDPVATLADYYLARPPCPTKLQPAYAPGQLVLEQVRQVGADGVVFLLEKFCEPHAFDFALVRPALERAGIPNLVLEMERVPSLEGLRTRLQAFVEML